MEDIAPHEGVGTQVIQNEFKGNPASDDREMGNDVDIATVERVYRYSISLEASRRQLLIDLFLGNLTCESFRVWLLSRCFRNRY